jgi:hypothetical protein
MLALRCARAPTLASRVMAPGRQMCTLNLSAVQQSIAQIKSEISKPPELVYSEAQVTADAQAGKIDVNKIGELFNFLPEKTKRRQ